MPSLIVVHPRLPRGVPHTAQLPPPARPFILRVVLAIFPVDPIPHELCLILRRKGDFSPRLFLLYLVQRRQCGLERVGEIERQILAQEPLDVLRYRNTLVSP